MPCHAMRLLMQVQKPVLTIPAHLPKDSVTSLDWSHERCETSSEGSQSAAGFLLRDTAVPYV